MPTLTEQILLDRMLYRIKRDYTFFSEHDEYSGVAQEAISKRVDYVINGLISDVLINLLRDSDTQITITNAGLHTIGIHFISSRSADVFTFEIDSIAWFVSSNGEMNMSLCYLFTGGEAITIQRAGASTATASDISISIAQMKE